MTTNTTKPISKSNTRSTLRDLNATNVIRVFRKPTLLQRLRRLLSPPQDPRSR